MKPYRKPARHPSVADPLGGYEGLIEEHPMGTSKQGDEKRLYELTPAEKTAPVRRNSFPLPHPAQSQGPRRNGALDQEYHTWLPPETPSAGRPRETISGAHRR